MKIDKEKVAKVLKSKKAMIMIMLVSILITIAFYGSAYALDYFGITTGVSILQDWGNVFIMVTIGIYAYIFIVLDEDMFSKKKKAKGKDKPKPKIEQEYEVQEQNVPCAKVEGMNCNSMNPCDEVKDGQTLSKCPECEGDIEIRKYSDKIKVVCLDCGIEIKEYEIDLSKDSVSLEPKPDEVKEEPNDDSIANGNCPFNDDSCVHIDMDGDCHGVCARSQELDTEKNPDPKDEL